MLNESLKEARVEIEGEKSLVEKHDHYYLYDKFKDKSDEELEKEVIEDAERLLASRKGLSPEKS